MCKLADIKQTYKDMLIARLMEECNPEDEIAIGFIIEEVMGRYFDEISNQGGKNDS